MGSSGESNIELESFIPKSSGEGNEGLDNKGPPYDAKSKRKRSCSDRYLRRLQRAVTWQKMLCFSIFLMMGNFMALVKNSYSARKTRKRAAGAFIKSDYSQVRNLDDLKKINSNIDHLCFPGMEKYCDCPNPMEPKDRQGRKHWLKAFQENKDKAADVGEDVDVVFYGDSITEGWMGTSFGFENGRKEKNKAVFESFFDLEKGGKYKGVSLGISGDLTTSLLWRLQNGEMPINLKPKVFWLLIGTNDIGNKWCSPEATLIGILRVVEEIRMQHPGTLIVLNSILPRAWHNNGNVLKGKRMKHGKYLPELHTPISDINKRLSEYSAQQDNVVYFDANYIFFEHSHGSGSQEKDEKRLRIDNNLMPDLLHPSFVGYKLFGDKIMEKLNDVIDV